MGERFVVRAGLALTMDPSLDVVEDPELEVADGRIVAVRSGATATGADVTVVDLPGRVLLPGLVNAHTHAAMSLLRGFADDLPLRTWLEEHIWPVEAHLVADDVHAGTLLAAVEMLTAGVTTFADMYFHEEAAAEAVLAAGGRALLAPGILDALGASRLLDDAVALAQRWDGAGDGRLRVALGPHATYTCAPPTLRAVAAAARDLGVRVHVHLAETQDEVAGVRARYGVSPIQLAHDTGLLDAGCIAAHAVWPDDGDVRLLAEAGTGVVHNPRSNMKLASGVAPVPALLAAGIDVGLGTDGAASTNQLTLFEEARVASLLQKVVHLDPTALPARTVLELATLGGARALGLDARIGSLTPGKDADVVALRLDRAGTTPRHDPWSAVVWSAQDQDVERVWVRGVEVARDGRPLLVDDAEVRAAAAAAAARLVAAAG